MTTQNQTRRDFLKTLGAGSLLAASGCRLLPRGFREPDRDRPTLRFGVIADVHHGLHPKARERLLPFIAEMNHRRADFIIQLGDFCQGYSRRNKDKFDDFMRLWNSFRGPKYHVLGNHDMDGCSKREIMDYWGMEAATFSFDRGGYHFVVLDSNSFKLSDEYIHYDTGNYFKHPEGRSYLTAAQIEWLGHDLAATARPTIIFSHRGLDPQRGVKDGGPVRALLEGTNREAGWQKVVACLCGHYHRDGYEIISGIPYIQINSAVYHWLGGEWKWVEYADLLYATVILHPGGLEMEGRRNRLVPHWPTDAPDAPDVGPDVTARISNLGFRFSSSPSRQRPG